MEKVLFFGNAGVVLLAVGYISSARREIRHGNVSISSDVSDYAFG
jgi:hypothetical protein